MQIKWYVKWKAHQIKKAVMNFARSPKTYLFFSASAILIGFINNNPEGIIISALAFLGFSIYLDYQRGIPNRWKRKKLVDDWKRKHPAENEVINK